MNKFFWQLSTLVVATVAVVPIASAQFAAPASPPPPRVMSFEEKQLRTLHDSGIPGLQFYPRVSGSTSTIPVGQLLVARALKLNGELRRLAPPSLSYFRVGSNVGFKMTPTESTGRARTNIAGGLLYDNDLIPTSAASFPSLLLAPTQNSPLQITFEMDSDPQRLQEYSTLAARNTHAQTSGSYMALASDLADLILVARQPSPDELKAAQDNNMSFDVRPVALDALVFIVNRENAVDNLTLEQVRSIYTGAVTNWKNVGGNEEPIGARTRDRNSGSEELMTKLVMGDRKIIEGGDRMIMGMAGTLDAVERQKNALAYSVYYYERIMNPRPNIKPLAIGGILPSTQTIGNGTYPLVEPVYVVTRSGLKADEPAAALRDWLLSPDGQKLIADSGYAPIGK